MSAGSLPYFEFGAVVLGQPASQVATWRRPILRNPRNAPTLLIMTDSATEQGAFIPAMSMTVYGRDRLLALRSAIDEALKEPQDDTQD